MGYDYIFAIAKTVEALDNAGELDQARIPPETWTNAFRAVSFEGVTGPVNFDSSGDRIADLGINYYSMEKRRWIVVGKYENANENLEIFGDVIWHTNSTDLPDIDIRPPFYYWSCDEKKEGFDETGKLGKLTQFSLGV